MAVKNILLVEDNSDDELLTLRALKASCKSSEIKVARDGAEALDYLFRSGQYGDRPETTDPELILLDLKLPKINGVDILKRLRDNERTKTVPVVVLTASAEHRDVNDCYQLGANSYVCKPINFKDFLSSVENLGHYWGTVNHPPLAAHPA